MLCCLVPWLLVSSRPLTRKLPHDLHFHIEKGFYFILAVLVQKGWEPPSLGQICPRSRALDRSVVWTQVHAQTHTHSTNATKHLLVMRRGWEMLGLYLPVPTSSTVRPKPPQCDYITAEAVGASGFSSWLC